MSNRGDKMAYKVYLVDRNYEQHFICACRTLGKAMDALKRRGYKRIETNWYRRDDVYNIEAYDMTEFAFIAHDGICCTESDYDNMIWL